jgi:hypothetical protein
VIRHNEMYSANGNYFNDVIGGEDNFTTTGFPNKDTDIYGNRLSHAWDDGIEAEGGNRNVRIWGNYIDSTAIGIATTATAVGPAYIWRNVYNRSKFYQSKAPDQDDRQPFFKSGSSSELGNGRRFVFHNTMLQASDGSSKYGLGGGSGIGGTGASQLINNTVSMNNIYHLWKPNSAFYQVGRDNVFQADMYSGKSGAAIVNGINATPTYAAGNGWKSEAGGQYALAAGTPGYDQGVRIPNFNDHFVGGAPDVGAAEANAPAMKFGLAAAGVVSPTTTPSTGHTTVPPVPPVATPTAPRGSAAISSAIDSSSYSSNAGQSVTFSVKLMGNSGTPTGSVLFKAGSDTISGCAAVTLANGYASCTTSSLAAGTYKVSGTYTGNATYAAGFAGPITQTVKGATAGASAGTTQRFSIDSSKYTSTQGDSVTFTVMVPNVNGMPTGTVNFTAGGASIAGCSAVKLSGNVAKCTTTALGKGSQQIRGVYAGSLGPHEAGPITQAVR